MGKMIPADDSSSYCLYTTGTHYSLGQDGKLYDFGRAAARKIYELTDGNPSSFALVYTGMSGVSAASAILCGQQVQRRGQSRMMYVRKDHEYSHGSDIEYNFNPSWTAPLLSGLVYVDDFVSYGSTLRRMESKIETKFFYWGVDRPHRKLLFTQKAGTGDADTTRYCHTFEWYVYEP